MELIIVLEVILALVLLPFLAQAFAKRGWFFTTLETGDIKFILWGQSLHRVIYDVPDVNLPSATGNFKTTTGQPLRKPWFGLYWVGIPPFAKVHRFVLSREKENPLGENPEQWVIKGEDLETPALRYAFPRPYVLQNVELGDRTPINVLVTCKFEVTNPYRAVFLLKGKFFENAGGILRAAVSDLLKGTPEKGTPGQPGYTQADPLTLDEFVATEKGEVGGILESLKNPRGTFNVALDSQVGLKLVGISIPQYDPSDGELRKAMNAETVARAQAKGKVAEAQGHRDQLKIRVEADAEAQERLARARGVRIKETAAGLAATLATPEAVAAATAGVLRAEALAGPDSKITTLVDGGTAPAVVPVGGDKK